VLVAHSSKIVDNKQKNNEALLLIGINFLFARTQRNHSQNAVSGALV